MEERKALVDKIITMMKRDGGFFHNASEWDRAALRPQFFGWLAGIGKGIRISWPEDVREAYKQYLQGIVDSL